jgi:AAA ATPase domain/Adenylate and Guanylate cyclase catalytic domain
MRCPHCQHENREGARYEGTVNQVMGDGIMALFGAPIAHEDHAVRAIGSDLHMDDTAVGQTTHLAARMEQMAKPGSVLITAETLPLAEGSVQVRPLGPVPVRGVAQPVEVCELLGAISTRMRLQAAAARGFTRFVGRQAELEALRLALDRTGTGHGQLMAVIGEPGVGKTRLFYEFTHAPCREHQKPLDRKRDISHYMPVLTSMIADDC